MGYWMLKWRERRAPIGLGLEHFQKNCSHAVGENGKAVFLGFGFVSAQSQGLANLLLRRSLAKTQKSPLRIGYSFSSNAPVAVPTGQWQRHRSGLEANLHSEEDIGL
jgi:hypothetical protein